VSWIVGALEGAVVVVLAVQVDTETWPDLALDASDQNVRVKVES
jgi:hypothetical protein